MSGRRAAALAYRDALAEFDGYTAQLEEDLAAGRPTPTCEAEDPEYQRLSDAVWEAQEKAPWWARFRWT